MPNWTEIYPNRNSEGYYDPTASGAIGSISRELADEEKLRRTVTMLKTMAELAGYDVLNRIELRDRRTGKVYR